MKIKPPRYLYRYTKFKYLENILADSSLYFCGPDKFNDPFDCKTSFASEGSKEDIEKKREAFEDALEKVNAKLGVLCLSEIPDDIRMWSHYSDGHKGIVLRFDREGLLKHFGYCEIVEYHDKLVNHQEFNQIYNDRADVQRMVKSFLLRKSEHWNHEREWRIIRNRHGFEKFPSDLLTGIILGCQMTEEDRQKAFAYRKQYNWNMEILKAKKDCRRYGIQIEPMKDEDSI